MAHTSSWTKARAVEHPLQAVYAEAMPGTQISRQGALMIYGPIEGSYTMTNLSSGAHLAGPEDSRPWLSG